MEKIAIIFDYFKEAFKLNKENKGLYKPQLAFIAVKTCLLIFISVSLYGILHKVSYFSSIDEMIGWSLLGLAGKMFFVGIVFFVISVVFEAGLYNMYKEVILNGSLREGLFKEGISKYFIRLLLTDLFTAGFWILISVPYAIVGAITLSAGFVLIPLIINIFTTMWKVSIVMDESGVFEGLKTSFNFAKSNFLPLSAMIIIREAFINMSGGSYGGSSSSNTLNWKMDGSNGNMWSRKFDGLDNPMFNFQHALNEALPSIKQIFMIVVPVVSVIFVMFSIIQMIFIVYFSLSIFVMYDDKTKKVGLESPEEVL